MHREAGHTRMKRLRNNGSSNGHSKNHGDVVLAFAANMLTNLKAE
jgi:hypothetical protein